MPDHGQPRKRRRKRPHPRLGNAQISPQRKIENRGKVAHFSAMTTYATTLDAADRLSLEEQEELAATLQRRIAERRRAELVAAVKEARAEFAKGRCKPAGVGAIMQRIRS